MKIGKQGLFAGGGGGGGGRLVECIHYMVCKQIMKLIKVNNISQRMYAQLYD